MRHPIRTSATALAVVLTLLATLVASASPASADPPGPPTDVGAVGQALQATVYWVPPVDDGGETITSYDVIDANSEEVLVSTSPYVTEVAIIGLAAGEEISFKVVANNADGDTLSAATDTVTIGEAEATFSDVFVGQDFFAEINWSVTEGIAQGYEDGEFKPAIPVSRQATAAFLYRFAGEPAYEPPEEPTFTDVPTDHVFYEQIEWLNAEGIAAGYEDGAFEPTNPVSRQAMAAFLYRFAGEPPYTPPLEPSFSDVPDDHDFYLEIEWLATTGITTGYEDGGFKPANAVSRQAMVTFLYRYSTQFPNRFAPA